MALPVIANTYRISLTWDAFSGIAPVNVIHVRASGTTESAVSAAVIGALQPHQFEGMPDDFILNTMTTLKLDGSSAGFLASGIGYDSGSGSGEFSPASAVVVSLRTARRGPRGRGRCYVGPILESIIGNGLVPGANADEIRDAWIDFIDALDGGSPSLALVVASYVHADANDVTQVTVPTVLGTQRRRQDQLR